MPYYYNWAGRKCRQRFLEPTYFIYRISADRFNVIHITLKEKNLSKSEAIKLCKELNTDYPYKKRDEKEGKRVKFVYVRVDESDDEIEALKEKARQINAVSIPKRDKYMEELSARKKAEIETRAEQYRKLEEKQAEHLKFTGWHYDNQQRVNEYKGTMRG